MSNPLDRVHYVHVDTLIANDWNPNHVMTAEMRLLEHSMLVTGWFQPILTLADNDPRIVDGFHRATLAKTSAALRKRDGGLVPIAALNITRAQAICVTVRANRAKGTHAALKMSELVQELMNEHGLPASVVAQEIGASKEEIALLYAGGVFKARNLEGRQYSKAWVPAEDNRHKTDVYIAPKRK